MALVNFRIDDRLIHGQVVIGWGKPLGIEFIVLVDAEVRESEWEQDLYRMAVPETIEVVFADVEEACAAVPQWQADRRRGLLITGSVETMAALADAEDKIASVTLGGIHHRPGRRQRLPYVYLNDEEYRTLTQLEAQGTRVTAQDVPTGRQVRLSELA